MLSDQVRKTRTYQEKKSQRARRLDRWALFDLLELRRELKWTLSSLPFDKMARMSCTSPDKALSGGDLGHFADVVREIRDMVN